VKLFRVNYEEYLHYEEFIEASSEEEATRIFKNSIQTLDPTEGEVFSFDVVDTSGKEERDVVEYINTKPTTSKTDKLA